MLVALALIGMNVYYRNQVTFVLYYILYMKYKSHTLNIAVWSAQLYIAGWEVALFVIAYQISNSVKTRLRFFS